MEYLINTFDDMNFYKAHRTLSQRLSKRAAIEAQRRKKGRTLKRFACSLLIASLISVSACGYVAHKNVQFTAGVASVLKQK